MIRGPSNCLWAQHCGFFFWTFRRDEWTLGVVRSGSAAFVCCAIVGVPYRIAWHFNACQKLSPQEENRQIRTPLHVWTTNYDSAAGVTNAAECKMALDHIFLFLSWLPFYTMSFLCCLIPEWIKTTRKRMHIGLFFSFCPSHIYLFKRWWCLNDKNLLGFFFLQHCTTPDFWENWTISGMLSNIQVCRPSLEFSCIRRRHTLAVDL